MKTSQCALFGLPQRPQQCAIIPLPRPVLTNTEILALAGGVLELLGSTPEVCRKALRRRRNARARFPALGACFPALSR
eukprot:189379-Alexandrium_andersonii.AAC.1